MLQKLLQCLHFVQKLPPLEFAKEVIENLLIGIKTQEERFADYAQAQSFLFDEQMELIHERQRSAFETLEKDFILHKHQFYRLLGKILW